MKKSTFILSIVTALVAGYGLGKWGNRGEPTRLDSTVGTHDSRRTGRASGIEADGEAATDGSSKVRRPRPDKPVALPDARRVSIPMSSLTPIIKQQVFNYKDFTQLGDSMETALTMLGVTDEEREQMRSLVKGTQERIMREEKSHIKVEKADATGVTLDLTPMNEIVKGIAGEFQEGIRGALKPETADALVESMDWKNFYGFQRQEGQPNRTEFSLERGANGELMATRRYVGGSSSMHLEDLPQEGKPMDISKHFGERWESYLKGVEMIPVDAPQP